MNNLLKITVSLLLCVATFTSELKAQSFLDSVRRDAQDIQRDVRTVQGDVRAVRGEISGTNTNSNNNAIDSTADSIVQSLESAGILSMRQANRLYIGTGYRTGSIEIDNALNTDEDGIHIFLGYQALSFLNAEFSYTRSETDARLINPGTSTATIASHDINKLTASLLLNYDFTVAKIPFSPFARVGYSYTIIEGQSNDNDFLYGLGLDFSPISSMPDLSIRFEYDIANDTGSDGFHLAILHRL